MRFIGHRYYEIMTRWRVCNCTLYVAHPVFGLSRFEVLPPHLFVVPIRESCLKVCFIFIAKVEPLRFSNSFLFLSKFMTTIYARLLLSGVA